MSEESDFVPGPLSPMPQQPQSSPTEPVVTSKLGELPGAPGLSGEDLDAPPGRGYWGLVWQQYKKRRESYVGLFVLCGLFLMALLAPLLASNLPLWVSGKEVVWSSADGGKLVDGWSSPLLRDFCFPLLELDRFYNCALLTLLLAGLGWLPVRARLARLGARQHRTWRRRIVPGLLGVFGTLYLGSRLVGGTNYSATYSHFEGRRDAQTSVVFTLVPYGSLEAQSSRSEIPPDFGVSHGVAWAELSVKQKEDLARGSLGDTADPEGRALLAVCLIAGGMSAEEDDVQDCLDRAGSFAPRVRAAVPGDLSALAEWDARFLERLREALREGRGPKFKVVPASLPAGEAEASGGTVPEARAARLAAIDGQNKLWTEVHVLGCDQSGFDVLARIIHGARISLAVGFLAIGLAVGIGIFVGSLAGYFVGWTDLLLSRVIEVFICFPSFFLILTIIAVAPKRSIFWVMFAIGITGWMGVARLIRGEVLKIRVLDYVQAARAVGMSDGRIVFRHILPNALAPVLVAATFGVAGAILAETGLGFLGLGVEPPTPSWGELLNQASSDPVRLWWLTMFPGFMIFMSVTLMNLVGEGLRDAMDPKMRR